MQARSAILLSAALRNNITEDHEWSPAPSTSAIQYGIQAPRAQQADFDSDDSVLDKDYVLPKDQEKNISSDDSGSEKDIIPCSQPILQRTILESPEDSEDDTRHVQLTKKGTIRKRNIYNVSMKDRKRQKKEEIIIT